MRSCLLAVLSTQGPLVWLEKPAIRCWLHTVNTSAACLLHAWPCIWRTSVAERRACGRMRGSNSTTFTSSSFTRRRYDGLTRWSKAMPPRGDSSSSSCTGCSAGSSAPSHAFARMQSSCYCVCSKLPCMLVVLCRFVSTASAREWRRWCWTGRKHPPHLALRPCSSAKVALLGLAHVAAHQAVLMEDGLKSLLWRRNGADLHAAAARIIAISGAQSISDTVSSVLHTAR